MEIKIGIYVHSKTGKRYRVLGVGKHSETLEELVIYEPLYKGSPAKFWVRPAKMFLEEVLINGQMQTRFRYIGEQKPD